MKVKRNYFDLSCGNAMPMRMGDLYTVYCAEMVPGDTFHVQAFISARFMPMQAPILSEVDIKTWGFAVPYRLVWDDYEQFFTGKNKKRDDVNPSFPRVVFDRFELYPPHDPEGNDSYDIIEHTFLGGLTDCLDLCWQDGFSFSQENISQQLDDTIRLMNDWTPVSVLELRAYQMIFNEWFRDQNIDDPVEFGTDSFIYDFEDERSYVEFNALTTIRKKRWAKDYFTSALPSPSMADDVFIPIDSNVVYTDSGGGTEGLVVSTDANSLSAEFGGVFYAKSASSSSSGRLIDGANYNNGLAYDPNGTLRATDNQTTIRELTRAQAVYQYLLDIARGGNVRYKDFIKTLFNVDVPDYRAEIPEYIGGGSQPVIVTEVLQTSETDLTAQGTMSGRGVSVSSKASKNHFFSYSAKEHSFLMVIACIMPKASYASGIPRRHMKFDRYEYYIPQFDHIGDQEIKRVELSQNLYGDAKYETFGYAPRYAEYKSSVSRVHGEYRSSLKFWTLARDLSDVSQGAPKINSQFLVADDTLIERPFFVQSQGEFSELRPPQVNVEMWFKVDAWRPMSKLSTPIV